MKKLSMSSFGVVFLNIVLFAIELYTMARISSTFVFHLFPDLSAFGAGLEKLIRFLNIKGFWNVVGFIILLLVLFYLFAVSVGFEEVFRSKVNLKVWHLRFITYSISLYIIIFIIFSILHSKFPSGTKIGSLDLTYALEKVNFKEGKGTFTWLIIFQIVSVVALIIFKFVGPDDSTGRPSSSSSHYSPSKPSINFSMPQKTYIDNDYEKEKEEEEKIYRHCETKIKYVNCGETGYYTAIGSWPIYHYEIEITFIFRNGKGEETSKIVRTTRDTSSEPCDYSISDAEYQYGYMLDDFK